MFQVKLERDSNQHSLDVKMLIFLQFISPYEKGNKQAINKFRLVFLTSSFLMRILFKGNF